MIYVGNKRGLSDTLVFKILKKNTANFLFMYFVVVFKYIGIIFLTNKVLDYYEYSIISRPIIIYKIGKTSMICRFFRTIQKMWYRLIEYTSISLNNSVVSCCSYVEKFSVGLSRLNNSRTPL
jgi:hypothetical protein